MAFLRDGVAAEPTTRDAKRPDHEPIPWGRQGERMTREGSRAGLVLPPALKLLPQFCNCICKSATLRGAMEFDGFDWDQGNRDKCRKHGVSVEEIESLFSGTARVAPDPSHSRDEARFRAVGRTRTERAIFVVFTWRSRGDRRLLRPISARYMHGKEVEAYEEAVSDVSQR